MFHRVAQYLRWMSASKSRLVRGTGVAEAADDGGEAPKVLQGGKASTAACRFQAPSALGLTAAFQLALLCTFSNIKHRCQIVTL